MSSSRRDSDLLSTVVHMSPYHFARLFKAKSTGVPPHRFVMGRRISWASALLREPPLAIGESLHDGVPPHDRHHAERVSPWTAP